MKKIVSLFLSFAIISILFATNCYAVSYRTQEEALSWVESKLGTVVGGGQCVDLVTEYIDYLSGKFVSHYAKDFATCTDLPSGWERIEYYEGFSANPGDIVVFDHSDWAWIDEETNAGHIGIVKRATAESFDFYDQNPTPVRVATDRIYTREALHVWGVIRPDFKGGSHASKPSMEGLSDIKADLNGDEKLDIIDVAIARAYIVGMKELSDEEITMGDANSDEVLDIVDVVIMRRIIVG